MKISINSKILKTIVLLFPVAFTILMIWLRKNHYSTYEVIGLEDHIIEYSQFFFFLAGGIVAFLIALKFRKISTLMFVLFLFASLGLIGIAGEEISWGERIFNIQAPEIFDGETKIPILEYNVQGEMNLHNFRVIHDITGILYLIAGFYLIFAYPFTKLLQYFFNLSKKAKIYLTFLAPPPILILYFLPVGIYLFDKEKMGFPPQDNEMVEFLLSLGILIFLILVYKTICNHFLNPSPKVKGEGDTKVL